MAVIALAGNTIGSCIGTGSFEGVGTAQLFERCLKCFILKRIRANANAILRK